MAVACADGLLFKRESLDDYLRSAFEHCKEESTEYHFGNEHLKVISKILISQKKNPQPG